MQYKPFSVIYNCDDCGDLQKKSRGCNRNVKDSNLRIDCTCGGAPGCDICARPMAKGKRKKVSWGWFTINRCPVKYSRDKYIDRFLPYYWHWRGTNCMQFPDNQGRIEQPSKLLEAFSICNYMAQKRENIEIENANKLKK